MTTKPPLQKILQGILHTENESKQRFLLRCDKSLINWNNPSTTDLCLKHHTKILSICVLKTCWYSSSFSSIEMENIKNFNSQFPDPFTHNLIPAKLCHLNCTVALPSKLEEAQNQLKWGTGSERPSAGQVLSPTAALATGHLMMWSISINQHRRIAIPMFLSWDPETLSAWSCHQALQQPQDPRVLWRPLSEEDWGARAGLWAWAWDWFAWQKYLRKEVFIMDRVSLYLPGDLLSFGSLKNWVQKHQGPFPTSLPGFFSFQTNKNCVWQSPQCFVPQDKWDF
jgi:hypothetical protein